MRINRHDILKFANSHASLITCSEIHSARAPLSIKTGLFLEWIPQNKAVHLMMFTQRSTCILNRDSTDVDRNKAEN